MKNIPNAIRLFALALAVIAAGAGSALAQGQIYVLETTTDTVKAGTAYDLGDRISIPAGGFIRAVMPSGKTQTIRGPYAGPAADLAKGQQPNEGVIAWLKNLMQTGGSNERTPGATRSMRAAEAPKFSWTVVPATAEGAFCVEKGAKLQLRRAPSARPERVTVIDLATSQRGEAQFAETAETAAWPAGVTPRGDTAYSLLGADNRARRVTLRVLDSLPGDDDVLVELAARECRHQFDAWVKEKIAAGKRKAS